MKRKSRAANKTVSGYGDGFSLSGGRRSQGWVGHSSVGRGLGGTRFRGANPMAVGRLGGESVVNGGRCSANDASTIKRSTMSNGGHIASRVRNPTSVFYDECTAANSKDWVQTYNEYDRSQEGYVKSKHTEVAASSCAKPSDDAGTCDDKSKRTGVLAVGEAATGAISASDYMKGGLLRKNCLPTPNSMVHWPQWINHTGCDVNYTTPGGGFPVEWKWGA